LCQTNVPCEYRNPTLTFAKHWVNILMQIS
jgi:hypothetical protein